MNSIFKKGVSAVLCALLVAGATPLPAAAQPSDGDILYQADFSAPDTEKNNWNYPLSGGYQNSMADGVFDIKWGDNVFANNPAVTTKESYGGYKLETEVEFLGSGENFANIIAIRQDGNDQNLIESNADGFGASAGISFHAKRDGDATKLGIAIHNNAGNTNAENMATYEVPVPEGIDMDAKNLVTIIDCQDTVTFSIASQLVATIKLGRLLEGRYTTASVFDAAGSLVSKPYNGASVAETGRIGFGTRVGQMKVHSFVVTAHSLPFEPFTLMEDTFQNGDGTNKDKRQIENTWTVVAPVDNYVEDGALVVKWTGAGGGGSLTSWGEYDRYRFETEIEPKNQDHFSNIVALKQVYRGNPATNQQLIEDCYGQTGIVLRFIQEGKSDNTMVVGIHDGTVGANRTDYDLAIPASVTVRDTVNKLVVEDYDGVARIYFGGFYIGKIVLGDLSGEFYTSASVFDAAGNQVGETKTNAGVLAGGSVGYAVRAGLMKVHSAKISTFDGSPIPQPVSASVAGGTYDEAQNVALSTQSDPEITEIRYTTDGSDPTADSALYEGPIAITQTTTLKAAAVINGVLGETCAFEYVIEETGSEPESAFYEETFTNEDGSDKTLGDFTAAGGLWNVIGADNLTYVSDGKLHVQWAAGSGSLFVTQKVFENYMLETTINPADGENFADIVALRQIIFGRGGVDYGVGAVQPLAHDDGQGKIGITLRFAANGAGENDLQIGLQNGTAGQQQIRTLAIPEDVTVKGAFNLLKVEDSKGLIRIYYAGRYLGKIVLDNLTDVDGGANQDYATATVFDAAGNQVGEAAGGLRIPKEGSVAFAVRGGSMWVDDIKVTEFSGTPAPSKVLASLPSGTYNGAQEITLSSESDPAVSEIYYTTDGGEPTQASKRYNGGKIAIMKTTTLKAAEFIGGVRGEVSEYTYTLTGAKVLMYDDFHREDGTPKDKSSDYAWGNGKWYDIAPSDDIPYVDDAVDGALNICWTGPGMRSVFMTEPEFSRYTLETNIKPMREDQFANIVALRQWFTGAPDASYYTQLREPAMGKVGITLRFIQKSVGNDNILTVGIHNLVPGANPGDAGTAVQFNLAIPENITVRNQFNLLKVEDYDDLLYIYFGGSYLGKIVLGGLTDGVYTTARVYDKDGTQVGDECAAFVREKGAIGFGVRAGEMHVKDFKVTEYDGSSNPEKINVTASVPSGSYASVQSVALSCKDAGATIYYTTDGSEPTTDSSVYSKPILVDKTMTIKAFAVLSGGGKTETSQFDYEITIIPDGAVLFSDDFAGGKTNSEVLEKWRCVYPTADEFVVGDALHVRWGQNPPGSATVFTPNQTFLEYKMEADIHFLGNDKGSDNLLAIRQEESSLGDLREESFGRSGIAFGFWPGKDKTKMTVNMQNGAGTGKKTISLNLPQSINIDAKNRVRVEDDGDRIKLYINDTRLVCIKMSSPEGGYFTQATVLAGNNRTVLGNVTGVKIPVGKTYIAFGVREGQIDVYNMTVTKFTMPQDVPEPEAVTASKPSGSYTEKVEVTLAGSGQAGAEIYYTTDGSDPKTSGKLYDGKAIVITKSCVLRATEKLGELFGPVLEAAYTITDVTAPQLGAVNVSGITQSSAKLSWKAATDNEAVTGYELSYWCMGSSRTKKTLDADATSYSLTGLKKGTTYYVELFAVDAAKNASEVSTVSFTTSGDGGGGVVPGGNGNKDKNDGTILGHDSITITTPTQEPPAPESGFRDMTAAYSWAKEAVNALAGMGIVTGVTETEFAPGASITRADFLLLLLRALKVEQTGEGSFADVAPDAYYAGAVAAAKSLGIAAGDTNGNFNPEGAITRQDMLVLCQRALTVLEIFPEKDQSLSVNDLESVSGYAKDACLSLVQMGLITGDENGNVNPWQNLTRAEAAVLIYRMINIK